MGNLSKSNAKLHEAEIATQLTQIKFKSFLVPYTFFLQPMDQGVIRSLNRKYRTKVVKKDDLCYRQKQTFV